MSTTFCLPTPLIKARDYDKALFQQLRAAGYDPVFSRIVAGRPVSQQATIKESLQPGLRLLDNPNQLIDGLKAADRIATAIITGQIIAIETDHDCDGQTSHAVIWSALTEYFGHPKDKIQSYIGHRLEEGYGLSAPLAARILAASTRPDLVVTADNGSSDELRIAQLKAAGIEVIVTDHHALPLEGPPKSAFAVVNPTRLDCAYPDKAIAGCMVVWNLMVLVRQRLLALQWPGVKPAHLDGLLDFVAVGTVADCVSLASSANNRAVVRYGLAQIQTWKRACWQALKEVVAVPVTSEGLGFQVAPLLNSDGRLSDAFGAVSFLLTESLGDAKTWLAQLVTQNQTRKGIQQAITKEGLAMAHAQVSQGKWSLSIALEEGHPGVHGIAASRIKEAFGRPTILFSPKWHAPELLSGSARSIDTLHIRNVLQKVVDRDPSLVMSFGGHKGAAGLTIKKDNFAAFSSLFEEATQGMLSAQDIGPCLWTDGPLDLTRCELTWYQQLLSNLEPFGREFEPPVFEVSPCQCTLIQGIGDGTHAKLQFKIPALSKTIQAVWFQCRLDPSGPLPLAVGETVKVAFRLVVDKYQGLEQLKWQVAGIAR